MNRRISLSAVCVVLSLLGCQNAEDKAAKARIFSPAPPNPSVEKAKVPVDMAKMAQDPSYALGVLTAQFPEIAARAKAGTFTVKETLSLERGSALTMNEEGTIRFNSHGDMQLALRTGTTEAMELTYANEVLFFRNRGGAWRTSRDPTDERHYWADQAYSALRTTAEMFKDVLTLKPGIALEQDGRKATRFDVALKGDPKEPAPLGDDDGGVVTSVRVPDGGQLLKAAQDRRKALAGSQPQTLTGFVVLDNLTGVPLAVQLEGSLKMAGTRGGGAPGIMTIKLETAILNVGKDEEITKPADAVSEIVRSRIPVTPLDFLDAGTSPAAAKSTKGQKPAPTPTPEPPEEEQE